MNPSATTCSGRVEGKRLRGVSRFVGIPYAQAVRFRPPAPASPWTGVRAASDFGPDAPQNPDPMLPKLIGRAPRPWDEASCLTLNVWTPAADGARRPVMVWLHGGAFVVGSGSDPWFDGSRLAATHDLVIVTVNYRLGAFGFLSLAELLGDDYADAGNLGVLDQIAALEWVRDNATAFGGDPDNVTVFGQSAGAMSIAALVVSNRASGLVSRAILQSGNGRAVHDAAGAARVAIDFLGAADLDRNAARRLLDVPAGRLLDAQTKLMLRYQSSGKGLPFWPVVDGRTLPAAPVDCVRRGRATGIALMLGSTLEEGRLFTALDPALAAVITDEMFRAPTIELADAQTGTGTPVWMYLMSWRSTALDGRLGACHSLDLPFVFDNLGAEGVPAFTGDRPPQRLADDMSRSWARFARTGRPASDEEWPAYDIDVRRTMIFDVPSRAVDGRELRQTRASRPSPAAPVLPLWRALSMASSDSHRGGSVG